MGIDVMIVAPAEDIASRPSQEMFEWLEGRLEDFDIRYGYIELDEDGIQELAQKFTDDSVGAMLLEKIDSMKARGEQPPYIIELMIGW
ncbi:MAG TPA: hypothetical protein VNL15_07350 [Dehalococcoidia bacterium]|nr:hypothetical protein [Dehalococcoidia bacterium]